MKELLGHDDIRSTQIYARIVQLKVSTDMNRLRDKLQSLSFGGLTLGSGAVVNNIDAVGSPEPNLALVV